MIGNLASSLQRVFDTAKLGPRPLMNLREKAEMVYEESIQLDEAAIIAALRSEGDGGPVRTVMRQQLAAWDFSREASWTHATLPNTRARRDAIYEALALSPTIRMLFDDRLPFFETEPIAVIATRKWDRWYSDDLRATRRFFWNAFAGYLRDSRGWSSESVLSLDGTTTAVVERLANPTQQGAYQAKGLVVGYVQSGKTANITGVVAKAADAGYRLIIILAGTQNMLRNQTQRRIDSELVGAELLEDEYLDDAEWDRFLRHGARPSSFGAFDWVRLTTRLNDYRKLHAGAIETLRFGKQDPKRPFNDPVNLYGASARLVIAKKNATVLAKLAKDLARVNSQGELAEVPTLLIDDESDQASVNTLRPPLDPEEETERTRINRSIVGLVATLPRAQYVGYTATPYANVFIDPGNAVDLFPKDFIVTLPRPPGYLGVRDFHDLDGAPAGLDRDPYKSNKNAFVRPVFDGASENESLQRAIDSFILGGAIKLYRSRLEDLEFRHHTMMVHTSHLTADHRQQVDTVRHLLQEGGYHTGDCLARLRNLLEADFRPVSSSRRPQLAFPRGFSDLEDELGEMISRLFASGHPVLLINSNADADKLAFDAEEIWRIIVGGAKLSRGFTVEGLTVSYFRRKSPTADTLMQMGRWCGFRPGYDDLVRLFIARAQPDDGDAFDAYEAFEGICRDEESFREELRRYAMPPAGEDPITPRDVPPLVASHLDWVQPTSKNKMYNAEISFRNFGSTVSEHRLAPTGDDDIATNEGLFRTLLSNIELHDLDLELDSTSVEAVVGTTSNEEFRSILSRYRWLDRRSLLAAELEFLNGKYGDPEIEDWVVLLPQLRHGTVDAQWQVGERELSVHLRNRSQSTHLVNAYSGPEDRKIAKALTNASANHTVNEHFRAIIRERRAAALIYPISHFPNPTKSWLPTIGFTLVFPPNQIRRQIGFIVKDRRRPDDAIVPASDR